MFASRWVVPFDPEPVTRGALYLADIANGTESTVVGKTLPYFVLTRRCHFIMWASINIESFMIVYMILCS